MDLGITRLFEERAHDLGALEHVSPAVRFEELHDVVQVTYAAEVQVLVAFGEGRHRGPRLRRVAHVDPLVSHLIQEVVLQCHGDQYRSADASRRPSLGTTAQYVSHTAHDVPSHAHDSAHSRDVGCTDGH